MPHVEEAFSNGNINKLVIKSTEFLFSLMILWTKKTCEIAMLWNLRPRGHEGGNAFFILYPFTLRFYDSSLRHISLHSANFPATFIWYYMLIDFYTIFQPIRLFGLLVYLTLQSRTQDLLKVLMGHRYSMLKYWGGTCPCAPLVPTPLLHKSSRAFISRWV